MHNDRIAEWLIESVTTPERAASTVGDLREIAATRGEVWFWASVLRTTASMLWHGMTAHPWLAMLEAFIGLCLSAGVQICVSLAYGLLMFLFAKGTGHQMACGFPGCSSAFRANWMDNWIGIGIAMAGQVFVGRCVGRLARGRELSPCLVLLTMQFGISGVMLLAAVPRRGNIDWAGAVNGIPLSVLVNLCTFLGALSVRHRASNRGAHA